MDIDTIPSPAAGVKRPRHPRNTRHQARAFTLVELLLALAITGMVSAGVATMLAAVSYGTSSQRDLRGVVVKGRVLNARLSAAVRSARALLESGTDYLVLWNGDVNTNGTTDAPDLSEMRLIERDAGLDELRSYGFPDSWTQAQIDAADVSFQLTGNPSGFFQTATATAKTNASFVPTKWGTGVTAISFALDDTNPETASLVSYRLTLSAGSLSETVVGAASARYGTLD